MQVKDIMVHPVETIGEDTTLEEIAQILLARHISCLPVIGADGKVSGIITESDFMLKERAMPFSGVRVPQVFHQWLTKGHLDELYHQARTMTAKDIMSSPVVTVSEEQTLEDLVLLMMHRKLHRVPVVREGVPVGMVASHELLKLMIEDLSDAQPKDNP